MNLIIYQADVVGKQNNCVYPHRREVTNADELAAAVAMVVAVARRTLRQLAARLIVMMMTSSSSPPIKVFYLLIY